MSEPDIDAVRAYLLELQERLCAALEREDGQRRFSRVDLEGERGGAARPRVMEDGPVLERAAVNVSHTAGARVPETTATRRPELAGKTFDAVSLSLIAHPRNPYAPTAHLNLRFFLVGEKSDGERSFWFGGGYDLTPCYGFEEDAVHWHRCARAACRPFGDDLYARCKEACDRYFHLPHRNEPRGIGGLFFDDLDEGGFERCFAFARGVGESFLPAYLPILERRKHTPHGERQREFQLYRRGRYVEFNLILDRGTRFGLQAGAQVESVLASLPPRARWRYDWRPEPGSPEAKLYEDFLRPRDWLVQESPCVDREAAPGSPRTPRRRV